jgi:hypothetical protein
MVDSVQGLPIGSQYVPIDISNIGNSSLTNEDQLETRQHIFSVTSGLIGTGIGATTATAEYFFDVAQLPKAKAIIKKMGFFGAAAVTGFETFSALNEKSPVTGQHILGAQQYKKIGKSIAQLGSGIAVVEW